MESANIENLATASLNQRKGNKDVKGYLKQRMRKPNVFIVTQS